MLLVSYSLHRNEASYYELKIERSNIRFNAGTQMELSNSKVELIENRFGGNGSIKMTVARTDQRSSRVLGNIFDGVNLEFIRPPADKAVVLLNNEFKSGSSFNNGSLMQHCDAGDAMTGEDAGCDPRAECSEVVRGDVQCRCTGMLIASVKDRWDAGVLLFECKLGGNHLDIFQKERSIKVRVRKPVGLTLPFFVQAKSEKSFNMTVGSSAPEYLVVERQWQYYTMSKRKSDQTRSFNFTLLGNKMNWPDSNQTKARITVFSQDDVSEAIEGGAQVLTMDVSLAPFGSCQHTRVSIEGIKKDLTHATASIKLNMVAMDSDGYLIENTPFNTPSTTQFVLTLTYYSTSSGSTDTTPVAIVRDATNGSKYSAVVAKSSINRAGVYTLNLAMTDAWDQSQDRVTGCVPTQMPATRFFIQCAPGYEAKGDEENACVRINFDNKCKAATVHMKGLPTGQASQKATATSLIGRSDRLSVALTGNQTLTGLKIRWVPLKAVLAVNADRGLDITQTGNFLVELTDQNSTQSCTLLSKLIIQCDSRAGFEEHKEMCLEARVHVCTRVRVCAYTQLHVKYSWFLYMLQLVKFYTHARMHTRTYARIHASKQVHARKTYT